MANAEMQNVDSSNYWVVMWQSNPWAACLIVVVAISICMLAFVAFCVYETCSIQENACDDDGKVEPKLEDKNTGIWID